MYTMEKRLEEKLLPYLSSSSEANVVLDAPIAEGDEDDEVPSRV